MTNGGTIPDRGLYGVFLAGERGPGARVGELDEEMVFESRVGETFLLGASSWRIEQISHDRVLVSPAPGEPGKMPFWKADTAGRPLELGRAVGELVRTLVAMPPAAAIERLVRHHDLDAQAAENLLRYLADQHAAAGVVPDDRTVLIERCRDELGDWRVCVLSPFGSRIHAPWAMAVVERARAETGLDVETMWTDDGFVVRFPETDEPPGSAADGARVRRSRGAGAAASSAERRCSPPSSARRRAARCSCPSAGLAAAARCGSCASARPTCSPSRRDSGRSRSSSRPIASACGTSSTCRRSSTRSAGWSGGRSASRPSTRPSPSPFAAALLFGYVANYLYDGDAPLAERRAQALSIDQAQLRELLGDAELRDLLDADAIADVEAELQQLHDDRRARTVDGVHDMLLRLGDSGRRGDRRARAARRPARRRRTDTGPAGDRGHDRRRARASSPSSTRAATATRSACRCRRDCPSRCSSRRRHAALDLARRYARTHAPFTTDGVCRTVWARTIDRRSPAEGARCTAAG